MSDAGGYPQNDELQQLLNFVKHDETAAAFVRRTFAEKIVCGLPLIDNNIQLRPGVVVEVVGSHSTGKTLLLIQICTNILTGCMSHPGSPPQDVVYVDLDGKFDMLRFLQVLTPRVEQLWMRGGGAAGEGSADDALQRCLRYFHLVRCGSSYEYLLALLSLDAHLTALQGRCRVVLLDGVNAFLWMDKAARAAHTTPPLNVHKVHASAAALLKALAHKHRLAVVATKSAVVDAEERPEGGRPALRQRESLPVAWQELVHGRLLLRAVEGDVLAEWQGASGSTQSWFRIQQEGISAAPGS